MNKKKILADFINDNMDALYRFAYAYTKNKENAEDVVCEAVARAMKSIHTLREIDYLKSWLYRIIINCANTMFRQNAKVIPFETVDTGPLLETHYDDYSQLDFNEIIEHLPPDYRVIIILRFCEDYALNEIAELLDVNLNTVKKRLYSSLKILKKEMEADAT